MDSSDANQTGPGLSCNGRTARIDGLVTPAALIPSNDRSANSTAATELSSAALNALAEPCPIPGSSSVNVRDAAYDHSVLYPAHGLRAQPSNSSLRALSRTPSVKAAFVGYSNSLGGSSSNIPSPIITAMGDVTPLPSPLLSGDSPGPWKRLSGGSGSPTQPRFRLINFGEGSALITSTGEPLEAAIASTSKRKLYGNLHKPNANPATSVNGQASSLGLQNASTRSVSEYIPEPANIQRRPVAVSGSHANAGEGSPLTETHIRREANLAESRGLTAAVAQPPTPPPSESSKDGSDSANNSGGAAGEMFEAWGRGDEKRRRWRAIRQLGQGTFSRVMLATSQVTSNPDDPAAEARKKLVAIKVCEQGPKGGASEERIEMSLKRELEIMRCIHHPSLVNLKAWSIEPTRAILVLSYCPGGDLFDVATTQRKLLTPGLLRRVTAELVGAVRYLHERRIVHRDIKLENVLVNLTASELADESVDWSAMPYPVITLTDLGLSRRVADDEKLETRCGSDDYAAPEVIMGQPYDGRAIDSWSLGVLLYALLEARLPFDPHPGMSDAHRMRSRTSHRIARVEWRWVEYTGDDGENEGNCAKFIEAGVLGAMEITEGLLKRARSRWSMDKVAEHPWVRDALQIPGGIRFREEEEGQEV